jgi:hypothetical protein
LILILISYKTHEKNTLKNISSILQNLIIKYVITVPQNTTIRFVEWRTR